jgi:hypothetical protein
VGHVQDPVLRFSLVWHNKISIKAPSNDLFIQGGILWQVLLNAIQYASGIKGKVTYVYHIGPSASKYGIRIIVKYSI